MSPKTIEEKRKSPHEGPVAETTVRPDVRNQLTGKRMADDTMKIDLGEIDDIRVLNERGEIINEALDPKLSDAELMRVHRAMVLSRKFDARMLAMQRQGQMGTFAPNLGQEATMIGQVYPMTPEDWFAPSYRAFGAQIWRGWPMEQLFLLWAGYFEGFPPPDGVNDLPFSIVIGSHVPTATGVAMGMKVRKDPHCVVTNFGDGAASQGIVAESLNFAAVYKAPCVFVIENNGWAISTPVWKQSGVDLFALRGVGYGVPSARVDGNDILAMITAMTRACDHTRAGRGPYLIEAVTYRMSLHTTADDPTVYRNDDEVKLWEPKCPIRRFEAYLKNRGLIDVDAIERIHDECEKEVFAARDRFREMARTNPQEIFDFVFEKIPPELEEQKQEYLAKLKRMGVE